MFNAILWIARSGAAWRDLPKECYGSWKTVYSLFCKWRDSDLLVTLFQALQVEPVFENWSIDSTSIKAHQHGAGAKNAVYKRALFVIIKMTPFYFYSVSSPILQQVKRCPFLC